MVLIGMNDVSYRGQGNRKGKEVTPKQHQEDDDDGGSVDPVRLDLSCDRSR